MAFTGVKDTDYKIMLELDDESLSIFCRTNELIKKYCNNDDFWFQRTFSRYGAEVSKPNNESWRDFYKHLTTVYISVFEYDDMKSIVEIKRSDPLVLKNLSRVYERYNDSYKKSYDIKSEAEVGRIVGESLCKAIAYFGQRLKNDKEYDVVISNGHIFDIKYPDSVLIEKQKEDVGVFQGWSVEVMQDAQNKLYYVDITNNKLVTLKDAYEVWEANPNYIYVPSLRVAGNILDIKRYFANYGNQIDPHINTGYSKNSHEGNFQREFLDVGGENPFPTIHGARGIQLPTIPMIPPPMKY